MMFVSGYEAIIDLQEMNNGFIIMVSNSKREHKHTVKVLKKTKKRLPLIQEGV